MVECGIAALAYILKSPVRSRLGAGFFRGVQGHEIEAKSGTAEVPAAASTQGLSEHETASILLLFAALFAPVMGVDA